jgi:hypothetical protein
MKYYSLHSPTAAFRQGVARTVFDLVVDVNVSSTLHSPPVALRQGVARTVFQLVRSLGVMDVMWMSPSLARRPPFAPLRTRRSCCRCTVLLASMWSMSPVNVDVSIIDKTATLLLLLDPSVLLPLYGLASIHVVYVSCRCECLHH